MTGSGRGAKQAGATEGSGGTWPHREPGRGAKQAGATAFAAGLFLVAFVLRSLAAAYLAGEPVWDGHYYDFGARRIAGGFGYSDDIDLGGAGRVWHPWCHYPVGYSAYLAAFYAVLGVGPSTVHVANVLASSAVPVIVFLLSSEALPPFRARLAGVLTALHPGLVVYGALVMSEPLSSLLVLGAFYVAVRVRRARAFEPASRAQGLASACLRAHRGPIAGALVLGVAALVRPQALLCAPVLALTADVRSRRARYGAALVACAVALLPVAPWTARNCRVMDGCALVSTNAGWNLAIGAFPRATGRFETLRSSDGCREVTGQVQQDRCWLAYGLEHIRGDLRRWLGLVPVKLAYTFDHESFAVEYLHEARPSAWPDARRSAARSMLTFVHRLLVAASSLAFVAFVLPRRRPGQEQRAALVQTALLAGMAGVALLALSADPPSVWPLVVAGCVLPWLPLPGRPAASPGLLLCVALVGTTALAHAVFFGEDRYHIVASPAFCVLAAAVLRRPLSDGGDARAG